MIKKILSLIVMILLVAWFGYYVMNHAAEFKQLSIVSPSLFILLIVSFLLSYVAVALTNNDLLQAMKLKMGFGESFMLSLVTGFYNLITPFRGGMAVRAVYLKKKHSFSYVHFLATLSASYVLVFLAASIIGLLATWSIYETKQVFSWLLFLIFSGMFVSMLGITIVSPKFKETKNSYINKFIQVINGWHLIKNNRILTIRIFFWSAIQIIFIAGTLYLQFKVLGVTILFTEALFLSSISMLSILIGITPASLGITEAIVVFSGSTIGIDPTQSLAASLLGRAVSMVVLFILGPICTYLLFKKVKTTNATTKRHN